MHFVFFGHYLILTEDRVTDWMQARNQLGTPGEAKSFQRVAQIL